MAARVSAKRRRGGLGSVLIWASGIKALHSATHRFVRWYNQSAAGEFDPFAINFLGKGDFMSDQALAEQMAADAADAVQLADSHFDESLDFSEASVSVIERMVEDVEYSLPEGRSPGNISLLCRLWGAYIGEVFRRNLGGEWLKWKDQYGEAIAFKCNNVTVFPHDKVRKRFAQGTEHHLAAYYKTFRNEMSPGA